MNTCNNTAIRNEQDTDVADITIKDKERDRGGGDRDRDRDRDRERRDRSRSKGRDRSRDRDRGRREARDYRLFVMNVSTSVVHVWVSQWVGLCMRGYVSSQMLLYRMLSWVPAWSYHTF